MQSRLHVHRKIRQIRIVVQMNNKFRLSNQGGALWALLQVQLNFRHYRGFQLAIDIAGNAPNYALAIHCFPSRK
jgi:hypothetical protein